MHISGSLAGSTTVSGNLTGVFSGAQIVMGLILGAITKSDEKIYIAGCNVMFLNRWSVTFIIPIKLRDADDWSGVLWILTGNVYSYSDGGSIQCSKPTSTTMAAACMTCGNCFGQLISPTLLNGASRMMFGEVTTSHVYLIATVGMTIAAGVVILLRARKKTA